MPALTLDIKTPNTLAQMAKKTARALDEVTAREEKLNRLMAKGMKTGKVSGELAKKTSLALVKLKKQIINEGAKDLALGVKRDADGKKQLSFTEKLSKNYLMVRDAVTVAWRAAKAMAFESTNQANELDKMMSAIRFEMDRFTSGTSSGAQLAMIEKFTGELGKGKNYTKELAEQFIKIRRASTDVNVISNEQAAKMTAVYADMRAISQSSEEAGKFIDEWVGKFKESPYIAERFLQLTKASHKEWAKLGSGDFARNSKGPLDLEDKADRAKNKMLEALAPLTKLMNDLKSAFADFVSKLASNKTFKNFIAEVVKDIRWFITEGLPSFGRGIQQFYKTLGEESEKFVSTSGAAMDKVGGFLKKIFDFVNPAQIYRDIQGGGAAPPTAPPLRAPPPVEPKKTGMLSPKSERQLAGITIQNLNVTGTGDSAEQIMRSTRQELQQLMQAQGLSKGYA